MKYKKLGNTDIQVSKICLGTMTWGYQNTQKEAFEQLDYAIDQGINFIDTAEIYPVPPNADKYGVTETYIGNYFKHKPAVREKVILATKVAGPGVSYIRDGIGLTPKSIEQAIKGSLKRLHTDYIDLYQLHWPQRPIPLFGILDYQDEWLSKKDAIIESLGALAKLQKKGLIREVGLSNEQSWGVMHFLRLHERDSQLPRIQSVQNVYSLVSRVADSSLIEVLAREQVSLLPYSPLAGGLLSGKYQGGQRPKGARHSTWGKKRMSRYHNSRADKAVDQYITLAKECNIAPVHLALAFVNDRKVVASNIIGATTIDQLKECISSYQIKLKKEILDKINAIHQEWPNPSV